MKVILLPVFLASFGLGGGLVAGHYLKPPGAEPGGSGEGGAALEAAPAAAAPAAASAAGGPTEFVKLDKQFVVPVISDQKVEALMVVSMAVEIEPGSGDLVFEREPKLRDEFLRVLFVHAQSGGFSGVFTDPRVMDDLRAALAAAARAVLGEGARSVLLTNLVRQDVG